MARNPMISFLPNGKNSKTIPRYLLKPNAAAQPRLEAEAKRKL
jgi:hypothetical protein